MDEERGGGGPGLLGPGRPHPLVATRARTSHDDEHNRHDSEYGNKGEHHSRDDEHDRHGSECGDKGESKKETKTEKVT